VDTSGAELAAVHGFDNIPYFCHYRNMKASQDGTGVTKEDIRTKASGEDIPRYADMFSAIGTEARLRIMRLLLSAHPGGMVVGDIQAHLEIPHSTLSHHLEKLRHEDLVTVRREGTYLWYGANTVALSELLGFLYAECCTRNQAVNPREIAWVGKPFRKDR
jgi:ArsR family transcriptional regulator, arsenate/arsenite/antimonite-responsive transcriptional repressor